MFNLPRFDYKTEKNKAYDFFKEKGVVILKNSFDINLTENMKSELSAIIQQQVDKHLTNRSDDLLQGNEFDKGVIELSKENDLLRRRLYETIQTLPSLHKFAINSSFLKIANDLGIKIPSIRDIQFRMDLPNDDRFLQAVHQEVRDIKSPNMRFMIVPLMDTTKDIGSLGVAPGSHNLGALTPSTSKDKEYQFIEPDNYKDYIFDQVEYAYGEVIVLNMYTLHGSFKNISKKIRWSSVFRCEDMSNMPFLDGKDWHLKYTLKG